MIYEFICDEHEGCGAFPWTEPFQVYRPMRESGDPAFCPMCARQLKRIYTGGQFSIPKYPSGFNPGLGKVVKNQAEHNDAIKRIKDETGRKLVEVGNEKPTQKAKREAYTISREAVHRHFNSGG